MKSRDSPLTGGREGTFYNSSSDESFALTQGVEDLFEKATSPRLIRAIYKQQNHAQVWVINQSCKGKQQNKIVSVPQNNAVEYFSNRTFVLLDLPHRLLSRLLGKWNSCRNERASHGLHPCWVTWWQSQPPPPGAPEEGWRRSHRGSLHRGAFMNSNKTLTNWICKLNTEIYALIFR